MRCVCCDAILKPVAARAALTKDDDVCAKCNTVVRETLAEFEDVEEKLLLSAKPLGSSYTGTKEDGYMGSTPSLNPSVRSN